MPRSLWMPSRSFREAAVVRQTWKMPAGPARLVFLTDIHMCRFFSSAQMELLCAQLRSLKPDMLLLGGDLGESREYILEAADRLGRIPAPLGRVCVLGNNDVYFLQEDLPGAIRQAEERGVRFLVNEAARFGDFAVAGLDDLLRGQPEYRDYFAGEEKSPRILLAHNPGSLYAALEAMEVKPHLALCGHTHGGQFRIGRFTPYSFGFERFLPRPPVVYGTGTCMGVPVVVSSGIGASRIPLRIGARPEIQVLEIEPEA